MINVDGRDVTRLPLLKRKRLAKFMVEGLQPVCRFSASIDGPSSQVQREMQDRGLEGLVAKLKESAYEPGRRSGAWLKFKWMQRQEFVIGGFTEPQWARSHFGALLVGYYQAGQLQFAGKVGTGFDERMLGFLSAKMAQMPRSSCPFANLPETVPGGLTASQMRWCTWVEPKLVAEVRFSEWTRDHHLRLPAFLGLRDDKAPKEVIRGGSG